MSFLLAIAKVWITEYMRYDKARYKTARVLRMGGTTGKNLRTRVFGAQKKALEPREFFQLPSGSCVGFLSIYYKE